MKNKRRNFLKKSAAVGAGFFIVPRNVLGGNGFISPSDQLNIAAIGAGGKGNDITDSWASGERVIALCDVHQNAYGAQVAAEKFPKAKFYTDFREMLEKENLDIDKELNQQKSPKIDEEKKILENLTSELQKVQDECSGISKLIDEYQVVSSLLKDSGIKLSLIHI